MSCARLQSRTFQPGFDLTAFRQQREVAQVELRRQKRSEQVAKRRAQLSQDHTPQPTQKEDKPASHANIPALVGLLHSNDLQEVSSSVQSLQRILWTDDCQPLAYFISMGIIPPLVRLLGSSDESAVLSACRCLTNLTAGSSDIVTSIVQSAAPQKLAELMKRGNPELTEQAAWVLSNIAGDSPAHRGLVLELGVAQVALGLLSVPRDATHTETLLWLLSNLCRGNPPLPPALLDPILLCIPHFLVNSRPAGVATACWILAYATDSCDPTTLQKVLSLGVTPGLIRLLSCGNSALVIPALRVIGNILSGDDSFAQSLIDERVMDSLAGLVRDSKREIRRDALWCFSSITAGTEEQVALVCTHPALPLIVSAMKETDFDVKKEAVWTVSNLTHYLNDLLLKKLLSLGVFDYMTKALEHQDAGILLVAMEAIVRLLRAAAKDTSLLRRFEELGGLARIDDLQTHSNAVICGKATELIHEFLGGATPMEVLATAPTEGFQFY